MATVVTSGGNSGGGGGGGAGLWIFIGFIVIAVIASAIVLALGLTVYKCAWGFGSGTDCATGTPTVTGGPYEIEILQISEPSSLFNDSNDPKCGKNQEADPNAGPFNATNGVNGTAWSGSTASASATPGAQKDSSSGTWYGPGCGWCDTPWYSNGACYSSLANAQAGTNAGQPRRRVWVNDSTNWAWCDYDGSKWVDNSVTGTNCANVVNAPVSTVSFARKAVAATAPKKKTAAAVASGARKVAAVNSSKKAAKTPVVKKKKTISG